jgi:hypothetical protein
LPVRCGEDAGADEVLGVPGAADRDAGGAAQLLPGDDARSDGGDHPVPAVSCRQQGYGSVGEGRVTPSGFLEDLGVAVGGEGNRRQGPGRRLRLGDLVRDQRRRLTGPLRQHPALLITRHPPGKPGRGQAADQQDGEDRQGQTPDRKLGIEPLHRSASSAREPAVGGKASWFVRARSD